MGYEKENPQSIRSLFDSIAERYDRANGLLSFQLHRLWNRRLVNEVKGRLPDRSVLLDLCAGTGDIAFRLLKKTGHSIDELHLVDFSEKMLEIAKQEGAKYSKELQNKLYYRHANAELLPYHEDTFDAITIAYGIRNVSNINRCFSECYRVLKNGKSLSLLELTRPKHPLLKLGHKMYLKTAVPLIGKWAASNEKAYNYLKASILDFPSQEELIQKAYTAGFSQCNCYQLTGGIVSLYTFTK